MKRGIAFICVLSLVFSLSACSKKGDYSGQTITGKVTSIEETKVTLQIGSLTEPTTGVGENPPSMPEGEQPSGQTPPGNSEGIGENPPSMPEGEQPSGQTPPGNSEGIGENPPSMPGGEQSPGQMPSDSGENFKGMDFFVAGDESAIFDLKNATIKVETGDQTTDGTMENISEGVVLVLEIGDKNTVNTATVKMSGGMQGGQGSMPGAPGASSEVTQGSSANTLSSDGTFTARSYTSTGDDENALRIDGATVTLNSINVDKASGASSNTESGDFYGMNAALLATEGANVTITDAIVNSSAQNGNGIFSYGNGTVVNVSNSVITTTADNSGGIQTTGGGTTNAYNLTVNTSGSSSAAIRSDRGGGTVVVDSGSYISNGYNSPAIYSTADITVKNAVLTANNSEALVIEGKNSITLENCTVSGNMSDTKGTSSDENVHAVMIYQSMSGDADIGTSSFSMTGGELICNNGDVFHFTNTAAVMKLSEVKLTNLEESGCLMSITGNNASHGWGTIGKNGAQVTFTAEKQTLEGSILVDTISTLNMSLTNSSTFTGKINVVENAEGGTAVSDNAVIIIGEGCTWTLTGDCTVTSVTNNGTINYNGYTITLADGSILK